MKMSDKSEHGFDILFDIIITFKMPILNVAEVR